MKTRSLSERDVNVNLRSLTRALYSSRFLVSFLLLTTTIPVLAWVPFANGESLITSTSTVTGMVTETQSLTTTESHTSTLAPAQFTIPSKFGTNYGCRGTNFPFTISLGQEIFGSFTSSIPVDFYIASESSYQNWISIGAPCDGPQPVWLKQQQVTSYRLPGSDTGTGLTLDPGQYEFLFFNQSPDTTASVSFEGQSRWYATVTTVQLTQHQELSAVTFVSTITVSTANSPAQTATTGGAATTVKAQACSDITCLITQNSLMIGAFVGVIVVLAAALRRRSAASTKSTTQVSAPATYAPTTQPQTQVKYCPDCASEMRYVEQYNSWWCDNCNAYKDQI